MNEQVGAILAYWNEHRQQLRQSETQRATLTNFFLVITAGLSGFTVQQKFAIGTVAVAGLIMGIGIYGALSSAKCHERAHYHRTQARALTATLKDLGALADNPHLQEFRTEHDREFPRLKKIRLHWLWTGLHLAVAAHGATLGAIALLR
ncbi:hypothetical protein [Actinoplanes sp. NPDC049118]|uniref:hypothetical protein n=1 Tax=Actinoplanes sp. NPDC049118 TaxID=3155769 RepID=UPI0033FDAE8E